MRPKFIKVGKKTFHKFTGLEELQHESRRETRAGATEHITSRSSPAHIYNSSQIRMVKHAGADAGHANSLEEKGATSSRPNL
uniref:Uncharacterized protein n=2 Tax=Oryza glumipatula TaxID=40148 RepID=A0A0D9YIY7_9ORYZ